MKRLRNPALLAASLVQVGVGIWFLRALFQSTTPRGMTGTGDGTEGLWSAAQGFIVPLLWAGASAYLLFRRSRIGWWMSLVLDAMVGIAVTSSLVDEVREQAMPWIPDCTACNRAAEHCAVLTLCVAGMVLLFRRPVLQPGAVAMFDEL